MLRTTPDEYPPAHSHVVYGKSELKGGGATCINAQGGLRKIASRVHRYTQYVIYMFANEGLVCGYCSKRWPKEEKINRSLGTVLCGAETVETLQAPLRIDDDE